METEIKQKEKDSAVEHLEDGRIRINSTIGPDKILSVEEYKNYKTELKNAEIMYKKIEEKEILNPRQRTIQLLYNSYNREIERMVYGDKKILTLGFVKIKITKEAHNKANLIAKRTVDLTGGNEIYMHLLNYKDKKNKEDYVIRDVYILKDQKTAPGLCGKPSVKGEMDSLKDIDHQGKYVFAWGHSHATMPTFHSSIDKGNLENVVSLYGTRVDLIPKPFSCSDTKFIFRFMPSLVFNSKGDEPSCYIGISYPHFEKGKNSLRNFYINTNPSLELADENNNIVLDVDIIDKEIIDRINFRPKKFFEKLKSQEKKEIRDTPKPEPSKKQIEIRSVKQKITLKDYFGLLKNYSKLGNMIYIYQKRMNILEKQCKKYESILGHHEERISNLEQRLEE